MNLATYGWHQSADYMGNFPLSIWVKAFPHMIVSWMKDIETRSIFNCVTTFLFIKFPIDDMCTWNNQQSLACLVNPNFRRWLLGPMKQSLTCVKWENFNFHTLENFSENELPFELPVGTSTIMYTNSFVARIMNMNQSKGRLTTRVNDRMYQRMQRPIRPCLGPGLLGWFLRNVRSKRVPVFLKCLFPTVSMKDQESLRTMLSVQRGNGTQLKDHLGNRTFPLQSRDTERPQLGNHW